MNIVGISGSPRAGGNTEILLKAVCDGAKKAGGETQLFLASEGNISGCTGCMRCRRVPRCSIDDAMVRIYAEVERADAVVFATPVYMGQMSAQAKAIVDRFYLFLDNDGGSRLPKGIKLQLVFTQAREEDDSYATYVGLCMEMFERIGFEVLSPMVVGGLRMKGEAASRRDARLNAEAAGAALVEGE